MSNKGYSLSTWTRECGIEDEGGLGAELTLPFHQFEDDAIDVGTGMPLDGVNTILSSSINVCVVGKLSCVSGGGFASSAMVILKASREYEEAEKSHAGSSRLNCWLEVVKSIWEDDDWLKEEYLRAALLF
jgi:hypothetical protein